MKGKKRFIVTMLFFINIIMLVAAVSSNAPTTIITPQAIHVAAANA